MESVYSLAINVGCLYLGNPMWNIFQVSEVDALVSWVRQHVGRDGSPVCTMCPEARWSRGWEVSITLERLGWQKTGTVIYVNPVDPLPPD